MSCELAGHLTRRDHPEDGPVAVWVCHQCPGLPLVLDPDAHEAAAHPRGHQPQE